MQGSVKPTCRSAITTSPDRARSFTLIQDNPMKLTAERTTQKDSEQRGSLWHTKDKLFESPEPMDGFVKR